MGKPVSFLDRYMALARERRSVLCVGLDLTDDHVPPRFRGDWMAYLRAIVDVAAEKVPVIKPQSAFYEARMLTGGMEILRDLAEYAQVAGILRVIDAKREDIGHTMGAYLEWTLGTYGFDAVTINSYLGPTFMSAPGGLELLSEGKMVIRMIRTSNPEGAELQDQTLARGLLVYEWAARAAAEFNSQVAQQTNGLGGVGGVVGATVPEQAARCRGLAPDLFFLIPGYGAQGGGAAGAVAGFPSDGRLLGAVNSSRGITMAWQDKTGVPKPGDPMDHVAVAIDEANADLNAALKALLGRDPYAVPA